jgi:hypothetical protein
MKTPKPLSFTVALLLFFTPILAQTYQNLPLQDWVTYQGSQYLFNKSASITNSNQDVFVAGSTINIGGDYDIFVVKYDKNGVELWNDQVNGSVSGDDFATAIILDGSGNVVVTGAIENGANEDYDLWIRKYSSTGSILWTDEYDGAGGSYDGGTCIDVDPSGNIYVGGATFTTTGTIDLLTRKYNSNGVVQWTSTWDHIGLYDGAVKIRYSASGISVGGGAQISLNTWRYAVLKFNLGTGTLISSHISTGGTASIDQIRDLTIDDLNNSYIVGGIEVAGQGYDIKLVKLNTNLNVLWEKTINGADSLDDMGESLFVDGSGNVYLTGYITTSAQDKDIITRKYNSSGVLLWSQQYNGDDSALDAGKAIEVNTQGDVFVAATSRIGATNDLLLIKYNSSGVQQWNVDFNGIANKDEDALDLAIDPQGNIILTGSSEHYVSSRFVTVRYKETDVVSPPDEESFSLFKTFRENLGQVQKSNGTNASEVLFTCPSTSPATFVLKDRVSFVMARLDSASTDSIHRVDILFNKSNTDQKFLAVDKTTYYENYYNSSIFNSAREKIRTFGGLYSSEVYSKIDLRLTHNEVGSKFYLICRPGFALSDLKFEVQGHDAVVVSAGDLVISTSLGDLTFVQGEAYELDGSGTRIDLAWQPTYTVAGNVVNLSTGSFNPSNILVLELDQGPATAGGGGSASGNMSWSTYLGNSLSDHGYEFDVNSFGQLFCAGAIEELTFPQFEGEDFDFSNNFGSYDSFVVRMNPLGTPDWAAYFGSSFDDHGDEVVADDLGNCFLAGHYSPNFGTNNLPVENGFQTTNGGGGGFDAFILKLDLNGMLSWASYYGGNGSDLIHDMQVIPEVESIVIVGGTQSSSGLPLQDTDGYFRDVSAMAVDGIIDGFIAQVSSGGTLEWSTYFGSYYPEGYTEIGGAAVDANSPGRLVITGNTLGETGPTLLSPQVDYVAGFPIVDPGNNAYIQDSFNGGFDAFIAEFDLTTHELIWSTLFGGSGDESYDGHGEIASLTIDGRVHDAITGTVTSSSGFDFETPSTNAYHQTHAVSGDTDVFIASFYERNLEWSTFIGGDTYEIPQGIAYSANRELFLVGKTETTSVSSAFDYCNVPNVGEFALCNSGGVLYFDVDANDPDMQKGFILGFNAGHQLAWSTFFGGTERDGIEGLALDRDNDALYISGFTRSSQNASFPLEQWLPQSHFDGIHEGPQDAFIARFAIDDIMVSVDELNDEDNVNHQIYAMPNPSNGWFTIGGLTTTSHYYLQVFSSEGKLILAENVQASGSEYHQMDLRQLPSGLYLIHLIDGEHIQALKVTLAK